MSNRESPNASRRPVKEWPEQAQAMFATSRRCLNWYAKNFGDRYSWSAISKGEVVFIVAKGEKGRQLRKIAESWGDVNDIELYG